MWWQCSLAFSSLAGGSLTGSGHPYILDGLDMLNMLNMLDWAKLQYSLGPSCTTKVSNLLEQDPDGRLPRWKGQAPSSL